MKTVSNFMLPKKCSQFSHNTCPLLHVTLVMTLSRSKSRISVNVLLQKETTVQMCYYWRSRTVLWTRRINTPPIQSLQADPGGWPSAVASDSVLAEGCQVQLRAVFVWKTVFCTDGEQQRKPKYALFSCFIQFCFYFALVEGMSLCFRF